jgi:acyl-CoA reductase-like NAD-dependent aldehyde dehydrogenase
MRPSLVWLPLCSLPIAAGLTALRRDLRPGRYWTNMWGIVDEPFEEGGFKQSGIGRARGRRAVEEFQEIKTRIELVTPLAP